jgi:excisionase family DNA binding protein
VAPRKVTYEEEWGTKEVSEFTGMSRPWVQRAAITGLIPSYRLSNRGVFHFRRSEVERWYRERTQTQWVAS